MNRVASEDTVLSATAPEPGQLVEVRRRQWIVSDVDASAVSPELPKRNLVLLRQAPNVAQVLLDSFERRSFVIDE